MITIYDKIYFVFDVLIVLFAFWAIMATCKKQKNFQFVCSSILTLLYGVSAAMYPVLNISKYSLINNICLALFWAFMTFLNIQTDQKERKEQGNANE